MKTESINDLRELMFSIPEITFLATCLAMGQSASLQPQCCEFWEGLNVQVQPVFPAEGEKNKTKRQQKPRRPELVT